MNVVWRREWTKADETPWSIFEKMSYANWVGRNEMMRVLGSPEVKRITSTVIGNNRRELFDMSGFDSELLNTILDINLFEQNKSNIESLIGPLQYFRGPGHNWFSKQLRWCPDCLDSGFHSWHHQFILVSECPYHGTALFESCPCCHEQIPFLFSDKRLGSPFMCKCGHSLADVYNSRWRKWDQSFNIKSPSLIRWLSDSKKKTEEGERWLFLPEYCDIEIITIKQPIIQLKGNKSKETLMENAFRSDTFRERFFNENRLVFLAIEKYIISKLLKEHHQCILQLLELRKEEGSGFNSLCPYAYAYVFWRKSILMLEHFYRIHRDDIKPPNIRTHELDTVTKLIHNEIKSIINEYVGLTTKNGSSERAIFWIMNKVTAQFSINFFVEWLKIAEEGAREEYTPKWSEIEKMKDACFPRFAFRFNITKDKQLIEFFLKSVRSQLPVYDCPNKFVSNRRKIQNMKSFTPQKVALRVFDNPSEENKDLQRYVDRYVRKLSF